MKKYIIGIICGIFLFFPYIIHAKKVTCSNGDFSATVEIDKEKLSIGEQAFLAITSDAYYEVEYKSDDKTILEISNDGIIKALKEGNTSVNAEVEFTEGDKGNCTVSIPVTVVSNDATLKKLTLEESDISAVFRSDLYEYEIKLPYHVEKINIIAEANNANAKITGDGRRYLNEGNNEYEVIVAASDGTTQTYKIIIIREEANDDVTLKNLFVEGYVLNPKFDSNVHEYSLSVDKDVEEITISAETNYEYAKIKGEGTYKLASGKNTYYVTVTAENGNESQYAINIDKTNGSSKLKNLVIKDHELDSKFDSEKYIYNVIVKSNIEKLDITAEALDNDQVQIIGNEKLEYGENDIIVKVTSDDKTTTTYKIVVNKLSAEEEKEIEKNNKLLNVLLVIFIVSVVIMATVVGIFLKRNYKKKVNVKKFDKKKNKKKK